nr:Uma2 family endonuclease [Atlanticothrix silvestris]
MLLIDKKHVYRRNWLQEYIVWQVWENKLDWFYLENGEYLPLVADADSVIKSQVFLGLWLSIKLANYRGHDESFSSAATRVEFPRTHTICSAVSLANL